MSIQLLREIVAFVAPETTRGTLVFPTGGQAIRIVGAPQFNQQPSYTDSEEIVNSRSRSDRFLDANPAGDWSLSHYARIGDSATDVPEHDVLYEAALGGAGNTGASYTTYGLSVTKGSISLWFAQGDMVFALRGASVDQLKTALSNKGAVKFDHSGKFMELLFAGKTTFAAGMSYTNVTKKIVLPTSPGNDYKKYSVGMRVKLWDASASAYLEDGSGNAYFLISAVTAADNSITLSAEIAGGSWTCATGDRVDPWYPTASLPTTRIIQMRSSKFYRTTAGSSAISILGASLTLADNIKYFDQEITDTGFPTDFSEGPRKIDLSVDMYMRTDDIKYFRDGTDKVTSAVYLEAIDPDCAPARTNGMQIALPKAQWAVPNLSGDHERQLKIDLAALYNSAVEDEMVLKFGDLTA